MFYFDNHSGLLELICGCMFAGKTEELIRRINVLRIGKKRVGVFKPLFDKRQINNADYSYIQTHGQNSIKAVLIHNLDHLKTVLKTNQYDVLCFDEVQFFPPEFAYYIEKLVQKGWHIICAGLDKGYNDQFFTTTMILFAFAEIITKLYAVCSICGRQASKTQRIDANKQPVGPDSVTNVVGGADVYQARCRKCFIYFPDEDFYAKI